MRQNGTTTTEEQLDRLSGPAQRVAALTLNGLERLSSFQVEVLQHYTHFALQEWRDLLEIHDEKSLHEYFDHRQRAADALDRRIRADAREWTRINKELTRQAQEVALRNMHSLAKATNWG